MNLKEIKRRLNEKFPGYYLYNNSKNDIKVEEFINIKCTNGHIWKVKLRKLFESKYGCPECQKDKKQKLFERKFLNFVKENTNNDYKVLDKYTTNSNKIRIKHLCCNKIFLTTPTNFKKGNRCPYCSNRNNFFPEKKNSKWLKEKIKELVGEEYTVLTEYKNISYKVELKHNKCNKTFKVAPNNFIYQGTRCPYCSHKHDLKTSEEFKNDIFLKYGNKYSVLGEYINNKTKISIKCNKCNKSFYVIPINILRKNTLIKCKYCECKESNGSKRIEKFLIENKILFEKEFKFKNCKNKRPLPFDFYLPDFNTLIEYDGQQHFFPIYGRNRFLKNIINDSIKTKYCYDECINLIRISYKDIDSIESILMENLM